MPMKTPRSQSKAMSMPDASSSIPRTVRALDQVNLWAGRIIAWLVLPMVFSLVYEVVARYLFNAPTVWAYDTTYILYGTFFMVGSGYTLMRAGHIRTDMFYGSWSPRTQGLVDAICYVLFFFPAVIAFLWVTWPFFVTSFERGERVVSSPWMPVIYPLKFMMPLTCVLLLVQGAAELLRSIHVMRTGDWLPRPSPSPALEGEEKPNV
jgi:TRAP-type mannitol/chloroaromatic compound transport system permease small subunit